MDDFKAAFQKISTCPIADALPREQVFNLGIKPLWQGTPRIAGPAYTVRCALKDNLMLHAAIHRAPAGSIIVVEAGDWDYAMAGGNVCRVAQKRGIAGFIIDGVIRDVEEIRENRFPVYARGVVPKPAGKAVPIPLQNPIDCGGVRVHPDDFVIADEEGIVVVPQAQIAAVLEKAKARQEKDAKTDLETWQRSHRSKIDAILEELGCGSW